VITYQAVGEVIIDGTGISTEDWDDDVWFGLIFFDTNESYITLDGFTIYNCIDYAGIYGYSTHTDITLKNLTIHDCWDSGIRFYHDTNANTNLLIDNCIVYDVCNGTGNPLLHNEAISVANGVNCEVKNCTLYSVESSKEGIDFLRGCSGVSIHDNVIYDVPMVAIYIDSADDISTGINIYNNLIYECGSGIEIGGETGGECELIDIYNNIVYGCTYCALKYADLIR
jgi:uncharacterized protein (DUF433 family)